MKSLSLAIAVAALAPAAAQSSPSFSEMSSGLSPGATISTNIPPRWSTFDEPNPGVVVNVATEQDVATTVAFCAAYNIPFLAQNGGNGWSDTFTLGRNGVLINLAALATVTISADGSQATVGGGALIGDVIAAASASDVEVVTGNCDCVGALGADLGAGYGFLTGRHGLGVDQFVSMNVVLANGTLTTITPSQSDLWWALRGAGPNFGIVTSAVLKAYPCESPGCPAWLGPLAFTEDKLEALVQAINNTVLNEDMALDLYFVTNGSSASPTPGSPEIMVLPFLYNGNATSGQAAFSQIYAVGPSLDETTVLPYSEWNAVATPFCVKGDRKPSYTSGLAQAVPSTWQTVWQEYKQFVTQPYTGSSAVLLEYYSMGTARTFPLSSASFPWRDTITFNAIAIPWYPNVSLDASAEFFGSNARSAWRSTSGLPSTEAYINFAHGDESLSVIYGSSLNRLQQLKAEYDPHNRFNQWFPI